MRLFISGLACAGLALASDAVVRKSAPDETTPQNIDGPYVTNPPPGPNNDSFDWWWLDIIGDEVDGVVPSVEAILYNGFIFSRAPTDPSFRVDVTGTLPNGTQFFISTPANLSTIVDSPLSETGQWKSSSGDTIAKFTSTTGPPRTFEFQISSPETGISGTITMIGDDTPPHNGCGANTDGSRYLSSAVPSGIQLSNAQQELFENLGWVVAMPGTRTATVNLNINGENVTWSGHGYHDKNWGTKPIDQYINTWLFGLGTCGPFHLGIVEAQPIGSPRSDDFVSGYIAFGSEVLQSKCATFSTSPYPAPDTFSLNITGSTFSTATNLTLPTNMIAEFVIANGTQYYFNLDLLEGPPELPVYHRWRAVGRGGQLGGEQFDCHLIGEWLNPGVVPYTNGESIFEA
ncbi:hypothetical protein F5884DRAFT_753863 [Xylogone sp. PMI_703]|nr:hypothetical protein F5884DRAFT_753863 [Xylogone sp. PMI_703]